MILTRRFFRYSTSRKCRKCRDLEIGQNCNNIKIKEAKVMLTNPRDAFRGQPRSPNIVPFHMLGIVSSCAIVSLSLRQIFPIFDFKKCRELEIWVRGHSMSLKVVPFYRCGCGFLLVFYRNSVRKTHGIWDIRLQKCRDLENRVRGPSRSLIMSPFDRAHPWLPINVL